MAAAAVLGRKRSFFEEDLPQPEKPHHILKKARFDTYENPVNPNSVPDNAEEWVQVILREMKSATDVDDARARAVKFLGVFENYVMSRATAEASAAAAQKDEENAALKQQVEGMAKESAVLKRAVFIQNEHLKQFEGKNQELEKVKGLLNDYKDKVGKLQVENYVLATHLKQASKSPMPSRFHPHIF